MKKLVLLCFLAMTIATLKAQRIYFIYLQTESSEPFFVRMNDKLYSSAPAGYLILSKLKDSTYNFKIGFPGKDLDLNFSAAINKKDHGYLIKDFGEKGWGLFDMQTFSIQMTTSVIKASSHSGSSNVQVNAFTDLLSRAADDPSLKQMPVFTKTEEKKPEIIQPVLVNENKSTTVERPIIKPEEKKAEVVIDPPANKPEEKKTEVVIEPSINKPEEKEAESSINKEKIKEPGTTPIIDQKAVSYKKSEVIKISGTSTSAGYELSFIDEYADGKKDTIHILIPDDNKRVILKEDPKPELKKEEKKFLDITEDTKGIDNTQNQEKKEEIKPVLPKEKPTVAIQKGNNCKSFAGNDDFLKLRRKMASKTNDDGMIDEAKKYFKTKCFTTEFIKNLSSMFLSSAGKYHFFDAAYNYVSDIENFPSLASELKDEFYINRFRSILRN